MDFMSILSDDASANVEITGGAVSGGRVYSKIKPAEKDNTIKSLMRDNISECAIFLEKGPGQPCSSDEVMAEVGKSLNVSGTSDNILSAAKSKLGCNTEKCVLEKMAGTLGHDKVRREILKYLKVAGPTSSSLLSNVHIDNTLQQWGSNFTGFYPYNFNMRNYASYSYRNSRVLSTPDTLATVQFDDLYLGASKYTHCGCVINSDVYQGDGKHWMALFADARGARWTVEFFNSSGNSPAPEWVSWMEKTKIQMERAAEKTCKSVTVATVKVTSLRHQESKSECGLYSLFYIWARIHEIPLEYFMSNYIPDQLMFEFRQHLFDDPTRPVMKKFDWAEYTKITNIKWEA